MTTEAAKLISFACNMQSPRRQVGSNAKQKAIRLDRDLWRIIQFVPRLCEIVIRTLFRAILRVSSEAAVASLGVLLRTKWALVHGPKQK